MPQLGDRQLSKSTRIARQGYLSIEDTRRPVRAGNALQFNPMPRRHRRLGNLLQEFLGPPS